MTTRGTFLFVAMGTRGDFEPLQATIQNLMGAGHTVVVVSNEEHRKTCDEMNVSFVPLKTLVTDVLKSAEFKKVVYNESALNTIKFIQSADKEEYFMSNALAIFNAAKDSHADCIISSVLTWHMCHAVARRLCIPHYFVTPVPTTPAPDVAAVGIAVQPARFGFINRFIWWVLRTIIRVTTTPRVARLNAKIDGLHLGDFPLPFIPTFNVFSPVLQPRGRGWPSHVVNVGFQFLPLPADFIPDRTLVDFLAAGPPPVYIGFGSMPVPDERRVVADIVTAMAAMKRRAIVCAGWSELKDVAFPENILLIRGAPHAWLLPQCAAAVHHGGAGTTAASVRAGIPTIIFPVMVDQPYWFHRIATLGLGPRKLIPLKDFTAAALIAQLDDALRPEVVATCQRASAALSSENGPAAFTDTLLRWWTRDRNRGTQPFVLQHRKDQTNCTECGTRFGWLLRRAQTCVVCGSLVCSACVQRDYVVNYNPSDLPRVCGGCAKTLTVHAAAAAEELRALPVGSAIV